MSKNFTGGSIHETEVNRVLQNAGIMDKSIVHMGRPILHVNYVCNLRTNDDELTPEKRTAILNTLTNAKQDVIERVFNNTNSFLAVMMRLCVIYDVLSWTVNIGERIITTRAVYSVKFI